jgi:3-hydroxyacyl-CoA dehydrogenase/enoyl-CoA hydratase/3-hydroxybutyryl-CoA epimerase
MVKLINTGNMNAFNIENQGNGVYNLIFDTPGEKVNKLTTEAFIELDKTIDAIWKLDDIKLLFFKSAKEGYFIVGADINEIANITDKDDAAKICERGLAIIKKIEDLPFPTVAVLDGVCMGGGLELALAFDYRISTDDKSTQIALPEVKLGIFPGLGGTQRLPRLIGLQRSLPLILTGKSVNGLKALKLNIVDACYHREYLDSGLKKFTDTVLKNPDKILRKRKRRGAMNFFLEKTAIGRSAVYRSAKKTLYKSTNGNYPAPVNALEVIKKGYRKSLDRGLKIETKHFAEVVIGDVSKYLIRLFFISESLKKYDGVDTDTTFNKKKVDKVGVLGAGIMGAGISWILSKNSTEILLKDINYDALTKGLSTCKNYYKYYLKSRKMKPAQVDMKMMNITGQTNYNGFKSTDMVIEAVFEDMEVKKQTLTETENSVSANTIIASNTSSLSITEMGTSLEDPKKFIGMHFFNPVNRMPLVEIIPGTETSDETIIHTVNLAKKMGKVPVVVKDSPGFLVNRILLPYMNEAAYLMSEGVKPERIDRIIKAFGMPMGPLELFDEVGIDVAYKVSKIFDKELGERMKSADILNNIYNDAGLRGKKSGKGVYLYTKKGKKPNPVIDQIVKDSGASKAKNITDREIEERIIYRMINESAYCLQEHIITNPEYLDMAMIIGTGFPPFRGGVLKYADTIGLSNILNSLNSYKEKYGIRFTPCQLLKEHADADQDICRM